MKLGGLSKMKLTGFKKNTFSMADRTGDEYAAVVNPETYALNYEIQTNQEQAAGTSANQSNFTRIVPQKLEFDFLFDTTGVLNESFIATPLSIGNQQSVDEQIAKFKRTVFDFIGDTHQPPYVLLEWGSLVFKCRIEKLNINYKLFKPDGTPLRAIAKATFKEEVEDNARAAQENATSPDLTHIRIVKAGDTLPLMCYDIYGDATLYREVARVNKIIGFRNLQIGQEIHFPPIEK